MRLTWRRHRAKSLEIALYVAYAALVGVVMQRSAAVGAAVDEVAGPAMTAMVAVAAFLALRSVTDSRLPRAVRAAWAWVGSAFVVLMAAFVSFGMEPVNGRFPAVGDYLRLGAAGILLIGVLTLPGKAGTRSPGYRAALDVAMAVTGGATLLWYLVVGPVLADPSSSTEATVVASAYPLLDLALVAAALVVQRRTTSSLRRPAVLLAVAMIAMAVGDVYLSHQRAVHPAGDYEGWQFLCWLTSCMFMAQAALAQRRRDVASPLRARRPYSVLPYAGVCLGYGLLLYSCIRLPFYPYGGLVVGAIVATALMAVRSALAQRENYRLAMTDSLTGLANRSLFRQRLERALESFQADSVPVAVLLIDLNGFKAVNDTFGHEAGDAMLVAVGQAVRASVRGGDTIARLGGDEFAVLLVEVGAREAEDVAARIRQQISRPVEIAGRLLAPSASVGFAVADEHSDSGADLLRIADSRMYREKRAMSGRVRAEPAPPRTWSLVPTAVPTGEDRPVAQQG